MRRRVAFFALVTAAAAVGSFLGAERKLSVLADQAALLALPSSMSTSMVMDASDLATALEGLAEVSPASSTADSGLRDAVDVRAPLGFPADTEANPSNSFIFPEPMGSLPPQVFEFRGPGILIHRRLATSGTADQGRVTPTRQGQSYPVEISSLAPGTRIAVRVIGRIPTLSKDDRID